QGAADADARVPEIVEEPDQLRLKAADERAVADAGQVLHGALADALAYAGMAIGAQPGVERHRSPVHQAQVGDPPVELAADAAEIERAGKRHQVDVLETDVRRQRGQYAEWPLHRQLADRDLPSEQLHRQATIELDPLVRIARLGNGAAEFAGEGWPTERGGQ